MLKFHCQVSYHKEKKNQFMYLPLLSEEHLPHPTQVSWLFGRVSSSRITFFLFFSLFFFKFFISEESEGNTNWLNGIQTPGPLF